MLSFFHNCFPFNTQLFCNKSTVKIVVVVVVVVVIVVSHLN